MNEQYYHIKNNGKFVCVKMDGTWGYAPNINFAYPLDTLDEAKRFAKIVQRVLFNNPTEVTDNHGNTINQ
jgi:hypothetical protein